jgi:hypothetical protein
MGATNFFRDIWMLSQNSPPNSQTKHRDVHDPTSGWMFSRNTAGHHKSKNRFLIRRIENRIATPIERSGFSNLKYPGQLVTRVSG